MSRTIRSYTLEFKREAVAFAINSLSVAQAAKELRIPEATLHGWLDKAKQTGDYIDSGRQKPVNVGQLLEENQQLKKRLLRLEQEKAILKKAATYFAKKLG